MIKYVKMTVFAIVLCISFIAFGLLVPTKVSPAKIPDTIYSDWNPMRSGGLVVKSFLGRNLGKVTGSFRFTKQGYEVVSGSIKTHYKSAVIGLVKNESVSYDGTLYAGMPVDVKRLHVVNAFEDGKTKEDENVIVPYEPVPLCSGCTIDFSSSAGNLSCHVDVEKPSKIVAVYGKDVTVGDIFDVSKVSVTLEYKDGTSYETKEFTIDDVPGYIVGKTDILITTPYGDTTLKIRPQKELKLKASYSGKVYAGDTFDESKISVKSSEGKDLDIVAFQSVSRIITDTRIQVSTKYGDTTLSIKPVKIKSVKGSVDMDAKSVDSITIKYDDGKKVSLSGDDIELLSQFSASGQGEAWFLWNGMHLSFSYVGVPKEIEELRVAGMDGKKYSLSYDEAAMISLACQTIAGDDMKAVLAEASFMANCYEAYGSGDFYDYIKSSDYWGGSFGDYESNMASSDMVSCVYDVICNGHRQFTSDATERVFRTQIYSMGDGMPQAGQTVVETEDGNSYIYEYAVSANSDVIYCSKQ